MNENRFRRVAKFTLLVVVLALGGGVGLVATNWAFFAFRPSVVTNVSFGKGEEIAISKLTMLSDSLRGTADLVVSGWSTGERVEGRAFLIRPKNFKIERGDMSLGVGRDRGFEGRFPGLGEGGAAFGWIVIWSVTDGQVGALRTMKVLVSPISSGLEGLRMGSNRQASTRTIWEETLP